MNVRMTYDGQNTDKDAYEIKASHSRVLFSGRIADLPNLNNTADSIKFNGETYRIEQTDMAASAAGNVRISGNAFLMIWSISSLLWQENTTALFSARLCIMRA